MFMIASSSCNFWSSWQGMMSHWIRFFLVSTGLEELQHSLVFFSQLVSVCALLFSNFELYFNPRVQHLRPAVDMKTLHAALRSRSCVKCVFEAFLNEWSAVVGAALSGHVAAPHVAAAVEAGAAVRTAFTAENTGMQKQKHELQHLQLKGAQHVAATIVLFKDTTTQQTATEIVSLGSRHVEARGISAAAQWQWFPQLFLHAISASPFHFPYTDELIRPPLEILLEPTSMKCFYLFFLIQDLVFGLFKRVPKSIRGLLKDKLFCCCHLGRKPQSWKQGQRESSKKQEAEHTNKEEDIQQP